MPVKMALLTSYGFVGNLDRDGVKNYNFYSEGDAPNYFKGEIRCGGDSGNPLDNTASGFAGVINNTSGRKSFFTYNGTISIGPNADPTISGTNLTKDNLTGIKLALNDAQFSLNANGAGDASMNIGRGGSHSDATPMPAINLYANGTQYASIDISSTGAAFNNTSDYRAKTNIRDYTGASSVIQSLNVKQYTLFDKPDVVGFIAHELQEHVPDAVRGAKDATEAIGTLADHDGTVIDTEVTEPPAEELTYTEEVEVTPYVAPVEATYDEEGNELTAAVEEIEAVTQTVTRTRTWTPSGTRPVYQGVDQTKLIPLLTKALQEALERIEVLEGLIAD